MGASCCKNALDKVRPPGRLNSFDLGDPPDPTAPWPGDTFFPSDPATPHAASEVPEAHSTAAAGSLFRPHRQCLRRRSATPAGDSNVGVLPASRDRQELPALQISSSEPTQKATATAFAASACPFPSERHRNNGSEVRDERVGTQRHTGNKGGGGSNNSVVDNGKNASGDSGGGTDGVRPIRERIRHAFLRASRRRFITSRLRKAEGSEKKKKEEDSDDDLLEKEGAKIGNSACHKQDMIDETHFVRYPPSKSSSIECVNVSWPSRGGAMSRQPAAGTGEPTPTVVRGSERDGDISGGQWTTGSSNGLPSTAVSWNTHASSSSPAGSGPSRDMNNVETATGTQDDVGGSSALNEEKRKGAAAEKKLILRDEEGHAAGSTSNKKRSSCNVSVTKDQRWHLKKSKNYCTRGGSTFRATVEGALPRGWRGSRASRERGRGAVGTRSSSGSAATDKGGDETDAKKTKVQQQKSTRRSSEEKRVRTRRSNKRTHRREGRGARTARALRTSQCSSASTAAQDEDDYTIVGMENWWTGNGFPSKQAAGEEGASASVNNTTESREERTTTVPFSEVPSITFGHGNSVQQPRDDVPTVNLQAVDPSTANTGSARMEEMTVPVATQRAAGGDDESHRTSALVQESLTDTSALVHKKDDEKASRSNNNNVKRNQHIPAVGAGHVLPDSFYQQQQREQQQSVVTTLRVNSSNRDFPFHRPDSTHGHTSEIHLYESVSHNLNSSTPSRSYASNVSYQNTSGGAVRNTHGANSASVVAPPINADGARGNAENTQRTRLRDDTPWLQGEGHVSSSSNAAVCGEIVTQQENTQQASQKEIRSSDPHTSGNTGDSQTPGAAVPVPFPE